MNTLKIKNAYKTKNWIFNILMFAIAIHFFIPYHYSIVMQVIATFHLLIFYSWAILINIKIRPENPNVWYWKLKSLIDLKQS